MANKVKVSVIKKESKTTGKVTRIDYAKVVDRLNEFRKYNPRSKIATTHKFLDDKTVIFKSYIWKDKSEFMEMLKAGVDAQNALWSADSEGTAKSTGSGEKDFEKLETISVGRALALLGYAVSGEVASSEEMVEFEQYKVDQEKQAINDAVDKIANAETIDELKTIFTNIPVKIRQQDVVVTAKDVRKDELSEPIPVMPEMEAIENAVDELPTIRKDAK